ncbi:hypothetical protein [Leucobacter soli]|uniref:hypothetical protein n=1 Tax=Leucobacter soli TaxID=2812850 RepID=UPI0036D349A9
MDTSIERQRVSDAEQSFGREHRGQRLHDGPGAWHQRREQKVLRRRRSENFPRSGDRSGQEERTSDGE